jgi:hypothetical protein
LKTIFALVFIITSSILPVFSQGENKKSPDSGYDQSEETKKVKLTIRNAPKITFEFSAMYDYGIYELSSNDNGDLNISQFVNGENFGVRHGFGAIMTAKLPFTENGHLRANISLSYNNFSSKYNKPAMDLTGYDYVDLNGYTLITGIENNFTPNFIVKTYIGIGITASIISGETQITDSTGPQNLSINPAFRMGISLNSGLEYMINNKFGFNCGIRFTHANLWFKQSKVSDTPGEINLNDKRVNPKIPYSGFKQFAWGSFFLGINYYIGIHQKEYYYDKH